MNGPAHYKAAEDLLEDKKGPYGYMIPPRAEQINEARVHAELALVAAIIDSAAGGNADGWRSAIYDD